MLHEVENHWKFYFCPYSCSEPFQSRSNCIEHVYKSHSSATPRNQLEAMINLNSRPIRTTDGIPCPICKESLDSVKEYQRHVGRHQEQLAIFALPSSHSQENEDDFGDDDSNSSRSNVDSESIGTTDGGVRLGELQVDDNRVLVSAPFFSIVEKTEPVAPEAQPSAPASMTTTINNASDGVFQKATENFIQNNRAFPRESRFIYPHRPVFSNERPHIDRFERPRIQTEEVESIPSNQAPDHNLDSFTTSHNDHKRSSADNEANIYHEDAARHLREEEERQRRIRLRIAMANAEINRYPPVPMPPASLGASSFKTTASVFSDEDDIMSRSSTPLAADAIRRLHEEEEEEERQRRIRLRIAKANAEINKYPSVPIPSAPTPLTAEALRRLSGWRPRQSNIADSDRASNGDASSGSGGPLKAPGDDFTTRISGHTVVRAPQAKSGRDGNSAAVGGQAPVPTHEDNERTIQAMIYAPMYAPYEPTPYDPFGLYGPVSYEHAPYDPSLAPDNFY